MGVSEFVQYSERWMNERKSEKRSDEHKKFSDQIMNAHAFIVPWLTNIFCTQSHSSNSANTHTQHNTK
jgi:hypothetical protein